MKKIASILLAALLLFNTIGYRFVFNYFEDKATARLESKIEAGQYNESQLQEIRIPLHLPYYVNSEFEACSGETDFQGEHYRYVKRKISGDTLYLLCLPHTEKDNINAVKTDFVKALNDVQHNSQKQQDAPSFVKLMLSEFTDDAAAFSFQRTLALFNKHYLQNAKVLAQSEPGTLTQPPELA